MADFAPGEHLSFGLQAHAVESDYPDSVLGRLEDESTGWGIDFAYDTGKAIVVSGDYGQDSFEWTMASRYRVGPPEDPLNDWFTSPDDTITSYGLGVTATTRRVAPSVACVAREFVRMPAGIT